MQLFDNRGSRKHQLLAMQDKTIYYYKHSCVRKYSTGDIEHISRRIRSTSSNGHLGISFFFLFNNFLL